MKLTFGLLLLTFSLFGKTVNAQITSYQDSVDRVLKKTHKAKKISLTDMINDSTGRTYYISKKTQQPFFACFKTRRDSITLETHYDFVHGELLRISCQNWNFKSKTVVFTTYYFRRRQLIAISPYETPNNQYIDSLLLTSDSFFARAQEIYKKTN